MPVPLSESLEKVGSRACAAHFYRSSEEWLEPVSVWLRVGLARGEKCVVHGGAAFGEEVLAALQARGLDVGNAMSRRALLILRQDPALASAPVLGQLEEQCRTAAAERFGKVRLCADLSPAPGEGPAGAEAAVELAAELRAFVASRDLPGLFLFRETGFPPPFLMGLLHAYPYVLSADKLLENYHYVQPGAGTAAGDPLGEFTRALSRLAERHEQTARIRRQAIRLGRLRDITATLLSKPASPGLLDAVVEGVTALGYRMSWVGMARQDGTVEPVAVSGDLQGYLKSITVRWDESPLGRGPTGTSIRMGRPDIVHDVRRTPRFAPWKEDALSRGFLSVAAIPLREEGKVAGALTVYAPMPNAFGQEAVEELSAFALQASLALERARDFRNLSRSEERLRRLFEQIPAACFTYDRDGIVRQWNQHCSRLYGLSPLEAVGRPLHEVVVPPDRREEARGIVSRVFAGESFCNMEWEIPGPQERSRWALTNMYPFRDKGGVVELGISVAVDITERFLLEEERERIRRDAARTLKMEAVGSLAGGIAHEFNNLLQEIIGYCTLLESKVDRSHPFADPIHKIQSCAERAADLTVKLLGFARGGKFRMQPVSLNRLAEHVLTVVSHGGDPSVRVESRLDPELSAVEGDEGQLDQTLLNLCLNARDAMPGGGVLTVATGNVLLDAEEAKRCYVGGPGRYVFVEVSDTGVGMTRDVQRHIFDPFYTTHRDRGRAGMGLPMAYGIVKSHSGGIRVESAPGEGTRIRVYLPAASRRASPSPDAETDPYPKGTETVLLVEDEPALREMGESMLQALGYRTCAAEDGEAACRLFSERKDEIALVVLDIVMPRMGGREAFREMRRMKPGIPVLLSSGYSMEGVVQEMLAEGANGFLPKPYGLSQVARAIRKALSADTVS
jgi:PAS domain S-box-containing protein